MNRFRLAFATLCFGFLLTPAIHGQVKVYAGLAFNQSIVNIDSLDYVVGRYNALNATEKPLGDINAPRGISVNAGAVFGKLMVDIGYTMRAQSRTSRETTSANGSYLVQRLRFRMNTVDIGFGVKLNKDEEKLFALGASLDFGAVRVFSRLASNTQANAQPLRNPVMNELTLGTTIFFHGQIPLSYDLPIQLYFRPYYHLDLYQNDYGPVNRSVNNPDHLDDPLFLLSPAHHFGMKVGIMFFGG